MTHDAPVDSRVRADLKRYACRIFAVLCLIWPLGTLSSAGQAPQVPVTSTAETVSEIQEPIVPLPLTSATDPARVALGARLFQDVRLSGRNTMACATCHQLARGGADGLPQAKTADGTLSRRNVLSIFNVAFNIAYHWDGVAPTLEAQAERVLLSPAVMDTTWPKLLAKLRVDPDYNAAFTAIYPDGLTKVNVLNAIATYERSLITPNARFDAYLRGERQALSAEEAQGYQLFKAYGCVACHQGVNVGGNMFQKFGIFPGMMKPTPPGKEADLGRFLVTGVERDRGVFRVPSLRNVVLTAPYFHDGRAPTLESAVDTMARVQLGRMLSRQEIGLIVQFLHTLIGEYPDRPLVIPAEVVQ
jgi:cytochrome c peroxidase